ncbi:ABC transporter substrate-binding protein [Bifidobacterium sp.]|jgi:multiple sugar transport system substrate-binding protein|uniref:ABC transporter substrate-binding protein n=1 Tax=Bifidobacterium sp. TaxID=41200 RepID=UPI0025BE2E7C|nr:extracellular solute-binding protein [Bifidobacterium sp.]MCI1635444.1 extracellular solute-binding protein [Bifidobacterium sp.]
MKFSKRAVAILGTVVMLAPLAACGGSGSNASDSGSGKTEVLVWSWDSTLSRTVAGFEKENPNITVKITNAGTNKDEYTALNNAMSAGKGAPDIAQIEYYALPEYVIRENVQNLSDLGASDYKDFYTPGTWSSVNINGGVYGLPLDSGPMAFFYNKEVFDKAGVTQIPTTWDEFYEAAKKIRATGSYITSDSGDAGFFDSMTWQAGATPFSTSKDGKEVGINLTSDSGVKKWTDFWQKMIDEDLIDTKTAGWTDDWNKGLNDGSIASLLTGAWMPYNLLSGAPDGSGKWRIAQMPTWEQGGTENSENGGSSLAIIKSDDEAKVKAAYKFLEYATHNAAGIKERVDGGAFPADNDSLASESFLSMTSVKDADGKDNEYFGGQEFNKELAKAAANVVTGYKFLPFEVYARGVFADDVGGAFTDKSITLEQGIAAWQKNLKSYAESQGYTVK